MKTDDLREMYLDFFVSKGCVRRPSDVLVPRGDASVLFTPAGMNQFKNEFLGIGDLKFTRATTCQKCLRTGDISNVGVTAYHHTFFEMLGNFSFGDYFKRDAIHWAWEFLTDKKWLGLDADRLTVTVFQNDDEAFDIWNNEVKLPADRIRRDNENENFWPAGAPTNGPDGVCGPCSEIFYHPPGSTEEVEIWNLVFTQFNRVGNPPDNLQPLPNKNIDTGMGLERTAAVLQGVRSNFEIDTLRPLCDAAAEIVGVKYDFESSQGRPLRRIADHVRAVTFCIHEGVNPGSEKESYVVRQLLRRALLEGYLLGLQDPFLHRLVPAVIDLMRKPYPEIAETAESVANVIREEEGQFLNVVDRGVHKFEKLVDRARTEGASTISGDAAFDLHQADGFLIELTESLAAKHNLSIDMDQFRKCIQEHKLLSAKGRVFTDVVMAEGPIDAIRKTAGGTKFLGYDALDASAEIVGIIAEKQLVEQLEEVGHESPIAVILNQSPFYGEAGGQTGDTGVMIGDGCEFEVFDTQRDGEMLLHVGHLKSGTLTIGMPVSTTVNTERRAGIRRAHSATHLLHHALRQAFGDSATQRGSKVEQDTFRFDFAHNGALTDDEKHLIEDEINRRISEGATVTTQLLPLEEARKAGAMALFGEKYPDNVRVVTMGDFSVELCGGTHLSNTGQIGFCKIIGDEPVAKGVRRVMAQTGPKALQTVRQSETLLGELVALLKTPRPNDLPKRVSVLLEELRDSKRALQEQTLKSVAGSVGELIAAADEVDGVKIITYAPETGDREMMRQFIDQVRRQGVSAAMVLGCVDDGKVAITAAVTKDLIARGLKAGDCVKIAAKVVGGGGGGRPDMAEAGGRFPEKLPEALSAGAAYYREKLGG